MRRRRLCNLSGMGTAPAYRASQLCATGDNCQDQRGRRCEVTSPSENLSVMDPETGLDCDLGDWSLPIPSYPGFVHTRPPLLSPTVAPLEAAQRIVAHIARFILLVSGLVLYRPPGCRFYQRGSYLSYSHWIWEEFWQGRESDAGLLSLRSWASGHLVCFFVK